MAERTWEPWEPPAMPYVEEALSARTEVVESRGRWYVYLDVVLVSGAVRKQVGEYHDERRAVHAARIIERNVNRGMPYEPSNHQVGQSKSDSRAHETKD